MIADTNILLIVNDSEEGNRTWAILSAMGYMVSAVVSGGDEALRIARHVKPDLIILEISPDSGSAWIETAEQIREHGDTAFLLIAPRSSDEIPGTTVLPENFDYYYLPLEPAQFQEMVSLVRKKHALETRLRKSEDRYHTLAELGEDMIFIVDRERGLEYANRAVMKRFGRSRPSGIGVPYKDSLSGDYIDNLDDYISRVIWWGEKIHRQDHIRTDERTEWYDTLIIPMKNNSRLVSSVIVVCRDITCQVAIEEKLRNDGIRQIEKNNEQFQILNDEIRNPLQVIRSLVEYDDGRHRDKVLEQVSVIDAIVSRLDKGWLDSEKVRRFLAEHYHHGETGLKIGGAGLSE